MSSPADRIFGQARQFLDSVQNLRELHVITVRMVNELLQRQTDQELRDKTLAHVDKFYRLTAGKTAIAEARAFSLEVIALIIRVRRKRDEAQAAKEEINGYLEEQQVALPAGDDPTPETSDDAANTGEPAAAPTSIIIVPPPKAETHQDFDRLLPAALRYRIGSITTYFQRWNPRVNRTMPLPFLLAVPFGQRLDQLIEEVIAPAMGASRSVRTLATLYNWSQIDSAAFWELAETNGHMESLRQAWQNAWNGLRPQATLRAEEGGSKMVRQITPALRDLRQRLAGGEYAIPRISNREIDLLASFLDPEYARVPLENAWTKLRQTYEQELDRRVYQDQARSGALRDSLLACFLPFTNPTAEFLAMLSYWNFPFLSVSFLTAFTHNHGSNKQTRERRIPYLMWYLDLPEAQTALAHDEARIAQANERAAQFKEGERERERLEQDQRDQNRNAAVWQKPSAAP
ncbi:MAG TPA: hypothetical protein VM661_07540 [Candidatus Sulfotelmatobacter sp.]|jgi:hypothetical protein|nr:hypothetical protein [Candidatus Sulfotelmatobacter sp.]